MALVTMKLPFVRSCIIPLIIVFNLLSLESNGQVQFFVGPDGRKENSGTKDSPLTLTEAISKASAALNTSTGREKGIKISLFGGEYSYDRKFVLNSSFKGSREAPIIIEALPGEEVEFDGSVIVPSENFKAVTDPVEKSWLAKSAANSIMVSEVTDERLIEALSQEVLSFKLNINGKQYDPSVFPNDVGTRKVWAYLKNEPIEEEIQPPGVVDQSVLSAAIRTGRGDFQEPGKPRDWYGSIDEPRGAITQMTEESEKLMAGSWEQWETEINRNNRRNFMFGLIEAVWKLNKIEIYKAFANSKAIQLAKVMQYAYRWDPRKNQRDETYHEFKVYGLLCELDRPGEWYFDVDTKKLYVFPPDNSGKVDVSLPLTDGFFNFTSGTEHVTVKGLSVKNVKGRSVYTLDGKYNTIASSTVRSCAAAGVMVAGENNVVDGCTFVDVVSHMELRGGSASLAGLKPGNNIVKNCHFYQKEITNVKVGLFINGHGNIFRNNLVHNSTRQSLDFAGTGHLVERNEFFNVGFTEGDGGVIYTGQNMAGYGHVFKHNFIHHNMGVPGKLERAGIYLDDYQAGSTCIGNVFYKCAGVAIKYNAGAGHIAKDNIMLKGAFGIELENAHRAQERYNLQVEIDANPGHPFEGEKVDYVGNARGKVGGDGAWSQPPWSEAYPKMNQVMSDAGQYGRYWPIRYELENNYYFENSQSGTVGFTSLPQPVQAKNEVDEADGRALTKSDFMDYDKMDFQIKEGRGLPEIPFDSIGLYQSPNRIGMPNKEAYRNEIRRFFDGINSMPGTDLIMNTGEMIERIKCDGCPLGKKADFLTFEFIQHQIKNEEVIIDTANAIVKIKVRKGVDLTKLVPRFTLSRRARIDNLSGKTRDFSSLSVMYEIISEDSATTKNWEIQVEEVKVLSASNDLDFADKIKVYPVPFTDILNINVPESSTVVVRGLSGSIMSEQVINSRGAINVSKYSKGVYVIEITNNRTLQTYKHKVLK